jgi:hypothetical protein
LTTKVDTGTGGEADTSACGTVNTVVKLVVVTFDINLLNTSAISQRKTPFSFARLHYLVDMKSLVVVSIALIV